MILPYSAPPNINGRLVYNVKKFGAKGDNTTDDGAAINRAITAAGSTGVVYFPGATYFSTVRHVPVSGQTWYGDGIDVTTIRGQRTSDYTIFYTGSSSSVLTDFTMRDMTINANGVSNASCMQIFYADNCRFERVKFYNAPSGGWLAKLGVSNGATETFLNDSNTFIDCVFDTNAGSLEMLLVFNSTNTRIVRPNFLNKTNGPGLGLWQKCFNTHIVDPVFNAAGGGTGALYFNLSCENIWITRPYFNNCGACINQSISDNGAFGYTAIDGVFVDSPVVIGGSNSTSSTAISMKSCTNWSIKSPYVSLYEIGINIGNLSGGVMSKYWEITNPQIKNNNQTNTFAILHPGIAINGSGGDLYGRITNGAVYDDQGSPTQQYPISIGTASVNRLTIRDTALTPTGSGVPIGTHDGGAIGTDVVITNVDGLTPDCLFAQGNITGATTFNRANGRHITATATGNITTTITNGFMNGDRLTLEITQDGTGGRTISKPTNVKLVGGAFSPTAAAGATDSWTLEWDGTNWIEISRALNVS